MGRRQVLHNRPDPFRAVLPTPPYLSTYVEGSGDILESRNVEEDGQCAMFYHGRLQKLSNG